MCFDYLMQTEFFPYVTDIIPLFPAEKEASIYKSRWLITAKHYQTFKNNKTRHNCGIVNINFLVSFGTSQFRLVYDRIFNLQTN